MDKAYIEWMASQPKATVAYEAFKAGYEVAKKWIPISQLPLTNKQLLLTNGEEYAVGIYDGKFKSTSKIRDISHWQYISQ